jgi:glycosyltransferase involved in cell wall biosynthesis
MVSVILPTYNRLPLLRKAIASVVAQTFGDWELIVADDGSTDDTRDFLEAIGDPRIRPLWLEHYGDLTSARSAGLKQARGEWVAFLDSDDLWLPEKLALQLGRITAQKACRWSCTGYSLIDAEGDRFPSERLFCLHRFPEMSSNRCSGSRLDYASRRCSCSDR